MRSIKLEGARMRSKLQLLFSFLFIIAFSQNVLANAPKVGKSAAAKYFQNNPEEAATQYRYAASETSEPMDHVLTFGGSSLTKSDSYSWGSTNKETNIASWGLDMSYRLSQYNSLLDYSLRASYSEYAPNNSKASKLIFMYAATLPDAAARFPLYFGGAVGGGVFLTQLDNESPVTVDYQLFVGMRLFDVFDSTGFYLEGGLKNHLQLTSDGQLNGTYFSTGAVFTF